MVRTSRIALAASCIALAGLLTGCGGVRGTATAGEIDVRQLEVGDYAVDRHRYPQDPGEKAALLEGMRMSEAVVPSVRIDPSLEVGRGSTVIADAEQALDFVAKTSKPVFDERRLLVGYAASGADRPDPAGQTNPAPEATAVTTVLFRFPDQATAKLAARELEDVDIAISPDNRKLPSTKYPDAYIHWRPGVPTVGAFMAYKEFVVSLFIQRPHTDGTDLAGWIDKTLGAEVAQLDKFQPTPQDRIKDLKTDPDGLLARVAVADRTGRVPDVAAFAVYGPHHMVHRADDESARLRLIEETGVDRQAIADDSYVARARDAAAAERFADALLDSEGAHYDTLGAPKDVPGAKCLQLNGEGNPDREYKFRCYVSYKRYVGVVTSDKEPDVRQKVAAEYALLANSL
ncbi:hypothetical protein DFR70_103277 [Nocardia tenerifensis]|uniref:PknH-like protein n=1 Tax=Nocardia tenerifensis TaxID=228006 RepID=A0A318K7K3_9NOCA|nr:hypothetical protein [Nocardia tenerifensis]PXX66528.1 hypothetical protein DFR70_103277 [Nocardia tenerifensis]